MTPSARGAFLLLILVQAAHSVEEYLFRLWEVLPPAHVVASLTSAEPATGFAIANGALVLFGLWCWAWPVRRGWRSARIFALCWGGVGTADGLGHFALAAAAGGYFPRLYTAPLLVLAGARLLWILAR